MYPLVSIICDKKGNTSQTIDTINSILKLDYPSIELLVNKHISEILKTKIQMVQFPVKTIKGKTLSEFRNHAIKESKGKYICFLSVPNQLSSDKVKRQVEYLESNTQISALSGGETILNDKGIVLSLPVFVETDPEYLPFAFRTGYRVSIDSMMFSREKMIEGNYAFEDSVESEHDFITRFSENNAVSGIQGECIKTVRKAEAIANAKKASSGKAETVTVIDPCSSSFLQEYKKGLAYRNSAIKAETRKYRIRQRINSICKSGIVRSYTEKPLVSVIIPTYNRSKRITKAIESVLNQTYTNLEVIVVDDCSTDNTADVIKQFIKPGSPVQYYRLKENKGPAAARNYGAGKAIGEYIAFHDDDDEWYCDKLDIQMSLMLFDKTIDMTFGQMARFQGNQLINYELSEFDWYNRKKNLFQEELKNSYIGTPTIVIKKTGFQKLGGFCEELKALEDWEFAIRASRDLRVEFINTPLMEVNVLESSVTTNVSKNTDALLYIIDRYYSYADNGAVLMNLYRKHLYGILKKSKDPESDLKKIKESIPGAYFTPELAAEQFFDIGEFNTALRLEHLERKESQESIELKNQYRRNKDLATELQNQCDRNEDLATELQNQCNRNEDLATELQNQINRNEELMEELKKQYDRNDELTGELQKQYDRNDELTGELQKQYDRNVELINKLRKD